MSYAEALRHETQTSRTNIPIPAAFETPNRQTMATLEAAEKGEDLHGPFHTVSELMEALNADD